MYAARSLLLGLVAGGAVLALVWRFSPRGSKTERPRPLGWVALAAGIVALVFTALVFAGVEAGFSIAGAAAAMVLVIGAIARRERHWPTWVGLGTGAAPVLFWVAFVAGELVYPH